MEFSLDPQRGAGRVAATFKLTPAMLACLEGLPGRATVTTSASGDKVLRVGDNSFTFTSHPDVPADLVRGGAFDARPGTSVEPAPRARVAASLRCHLKHKRPLTGTNGVAASVKRRFEQADGDRRARKAVVVDYIAPEPRETRRRNRRGETSAGDASTSAAKPPRRVLRAPPKPKPKPKRTETPSVAAPSALISERLAALAAAAARAASSRAANQLRAALLVILSERPLTFAAAHAAATAGLVAANLPTPPRSAVEEAVKRVASYRAPGRLHVDAALREEGAELLRAAEAEAPATVRTPPLRVPSSVGFASSGGVIDRDIAAGLTDEEGGNTPDCAPGGARETANVEDASAEDGSPPPRPRAVGDDDDAWMAYIPEVKAAKEGTSAGAFRGDGDRSDATRIGDAIGEATVSSDAEFRRRRAAFNREYATYAKTHAALEANAREFAALRERRDTAVARGEASAAGLTRRAAEFRVIRHERYAEMARVFEHLEAKLGAVKRALEAYAKSRAGRRGTGTERRGRATIHT